ncbi:lipocalin family protein [uncultured Caulobacter sp.]|uniref:lipocalin family protein n=1 Tax=uncultured Caulobacter sp. TaxID=158749 RepID=UPI00260BAE61|nr:lipocalin family protein [uncultured Caulobacter sp.]
MPHAPVALFALAAALTAAGPAVPRPTPIDADSHYSGTWLEVGRTPMGVTKGCVAATTVYKRLDDRRVDVEDDCRQGGIDGKRRAIRGKGVIEDPGVNRRLKVSYLPFVTWRYEVLETDPNGAWFISASPDKKKVFLYARRPLPQAQLDDLAARARHAGYAGEIEFPETRPVSP